jgi:hypothetical protein
MENDFQKELRLKKKYKLDEDEQLVISYLMVQKYDALNYKLYSSLGGNPEKWVIILGKFKRLGLVKQRNDYIWLSEGV